MPRKQHDYHYIYKTTNLVNEKFYIGMHSTSNLEDGYIGSGKRLWYSIKKYGRENFKMEILEFLPDRSSLKLRERELVNESLLQDPMCMNLQLGGGGGFLSEEHQLKCSSAAGKKSIGRKCEHVSIMNKFLHANNILKAPDWTGKSHKQETKDKIGESVKVSQKGEKNSQYGTCWIKHEEFGVKKVKNADYERLSLLGWKKGR